MIRALVPRDLERCMDLAVRVGWPRESEKWRRLFEAGPGYGVEGEGETLSAMVMTPSFEGLSFVAMMVVDPAQQGRGLGRALLAEALAHTPAPVALYATARGRPLYERLGFVEVDGVSKHIGRIEMDASGAPNRDKAALDAPSILAADRRAFGADRASLLSSLLASAERVVTDESGGFAIRWWNGHLSVVGPIVAADEDRAIQLFDRSLEGFSGLARIDVSRRFGRLRARAEARGLPGLDVAPLMTWPSPWLRGERDAYFAIALQAFG